MIKNRRPRIHTGIEIDSRTLRLAQVISGPDGHTLAGFYERKLEPGLFESGSPTDAKAVAKELRALIKENGVKVQTAHLSAGNEHSILRLITPPPLQGRQLDAVLEYELKNHLPVTDSEAEIRYETVMDKDEMRILVGAVRKHHVQALMSLAGAAGVRVQSLEPPTLAALRAAPCQPDVEAEIFVDVAGESSSVTGRTPQTLFMNRIGDAGRARFEENPNAAARSLISDMDDVAAFITNQMTNQFRIVLTGAAWRYPELASMIDRHFGRAPEHPSFLDELVVPAELAEPLEPYTTAIGLAVKGEGRK